MKQIIFICSLVIIATPNLQTTDQNRSSLRLDHALATAQQALNFYKRNAPKTDYNNLLAYLDFYRSWYQSVTPAPMPLIEQLSLAALQFVSQLKHIAQDFTIKTPRGIAGASRLTPEGELFYQEVIQMVQEQLIENKLASIMVIPHVQTRLF